MKVFECEKPGFHHVSASIDVRKKHIVICDMDIDMNSSCSSIEEALSFAFNDLKMAYPNHKLMLNAHYRNNTIIASVFEFQNGKLPKESPKSVNPDRECERF